MTTIHGFFSIAPGFWLPVYKKYNDTAFYVSISDADRSPGLDYIATIHHGIDIQLFDFQSAPDDTLLFFGRIHNDKGARQAIEIAKASSKKLILAGIIQDQAYFDHYVAPHIDDGHGHLCRQRRTGGAQSAARQRLRAFTPHPV